MSDYIYNWASGRYVKKDGKIGRKLSKLYWQLGGGEESVASSYPQWYESAKKIVDAGLMSWDDMYKALGQVQSVVLPLIEQYINERRYGSDRLQKKFNLVI